MKKRLTCLVCTLLAVLAGAGCARQAPAGPAVSYLNGHPESDAVLQELAGRYTQETGIPVRVVTPAEGTYSQALAEALAGENPPTIFHLSDREELSRWNDCTLELAGTKAAKALLSKDFALLDDAGAMKGIGIRMEAYGLVVNCCLLELSGHTLEEITDFDTLKSVADDLHARSAELGFDAFAAPGLEDTASLRFSGHLVNLPLFYEFRDRGISGQPAILAGDYLPCLKNIWDLYITDTPADAQYLNAFTDEEALAQFIQEQAVFCQSGSWEYDALAQALPELAVLPLYCGSPGEENAGLCADVGDYWAVNAEAGEEDVQAAADFLAWLVSDPEASRLLSGTDGALPYETASPPANGMLAAAAAQLAQGKYPVTWAFRRTPNADSWRRTVVTALTAYAQAPSEDNWEKVVDAMVDGWAYEYKMEHQ